MAKQRSAIAFLLFLLMPGISFSQAWQVNGTNLETDNSTDDVHVQNHLGVGVAPNGTDYLKLNSLMLMDYPNDGDYNTIHTTSTSYGLRLCAGADDVTSSSMRMYASSHASLPGAIGFTAYQLSLSSGGPIGFKFSNYLVSTTTTSDLMTIMKSGKVGIGTNSPNEKLEIMDGNVAINSTGDAAIRKILGYSVTKGMQLCANTLQSDGPSIGLVARNNTTDPGCIGLVNYGAGSKFGFYKYDPAFTTPLFEQLRIQSNGNISMLKRNDLDYRQIEAHSLLGRLSMHSNNASNNGTTIELWGNNHEDKPGQIHFIDYNTAGEFHFLQYRPAISQEVLQVRIDNKGDMYMERALAETETRILGSRTQYGAMTVRANMAANDGTGLELYGAYHASNPGHVHLIDYGNTGEFQFIRYEPSTAQFLKQVVVSNSGNIYMYKPLDDSQWREVAAKTTTGGLVVGTQNGSGNGSRIEMYGTGVADAARKGAIHFVANEAGSADGIGFNFINQNATSPYFYGLMRIYKNGKVAIGGDANIMDVTSDDYKLFVEKGIMTERVRVAVKNSLEWSDHVFAKDYKLMPLAEVSEYINNNKHLPGIPSAEDVVKNGIDLGAMDARLLQKIEELTLYVTQQQKEIEELKELVKKK